MSKLSSAKSDMKIISVEFLITRAQRETIHQLSYTLYHRIYPFECIQDKNF